MTETPILDESAIAEIESRHARVNSHFEELVILTPAERDALCTTVKRQNAEVRAVLNALGQDAVRVREDGGPEDVYASLAVSVARLHTDTTRLRASRRVHELDNHHNALACGYCAGPLKDELTRLQSQLEQLRAERDRFSELADKRHDELCEARRQRDSLAAKHVEFTRDAMTAAVNDFRKHAVQICESKGAEWAESGKFGIELMQGKAAAAREITQALEKL